MATKIKKTKLTEAEPMVDQNMAPAPAQPATPVDMAQAPVQPTEVPVDPVAEPVSEPVMDAPVEEAPIEVNPATVGVEVQIPTDQLAAAVAQATGDVVPAETAPDAVDAQNAEMMAEEPMVADETMPAEPAPMTDPGMGQTAPTQPVMESCEAKEEKIEEAVDAPDVESQAVEQKMEGDLEQIIKTGVNNTAEGLVNGKPGINEDNIENRFDQIKTGVETMGKELKESEEDEVEPEAVEDVLENIDVPEDEELPPEDLPVAMAPGEGDEEIDAMFDREPDSDELLGKIEDFLGKEEVEVEDVSDALRTAASFLDQIADDKKFNFADVVGEPEEVEAEDVEDILDEPAPVKDEELDEFDDVDIVEDDKEDDFVESVRKPCKMPERMTHKPVVTPRHSLKESSIIYPAGSAPEGYRSEDDLVSTQEKIHNARREAIMNYRKSVLAEREKVEKPNRSRFNEALNCSVKAIKESEESDPNSWESNTFISKYEESAKLNYKDLLRGGFLG